MVRDRRRDRSLAGTYEALLRIYPRRWRTNDRAAEMLSVLLDQAEADNRTKPSRSEAIDLVSHGLLERARTTEDVLPTIARARVAQVSLVAGVALAIFAFCAGEIRLPGLSDGHSPRHLDEFLPPRWGPFQTLGVATYLSWFASFGAFLAGRVTICRDLAGIAGAIAVATPALATIFDHQRPPGGLLVCFSCLSLGVWLWPRKSGAPSLSVRYWSAIAVAILSSALVVWRLNLLNRPLDSFTYDERSARAMFYWAPRHDAEQLNRVLAPIALWVVAVGIMIAIVVWRWDRTSLPAFAWLLLPDALLRLGTVNYRPPHSTRDALVAAGAVFALIVVNGLIVVRVLRTPWVSRHRSRTRREQRSS